MNKIERGNGVTISKASNQKNVNAGAISNAFDVFDFGTTEAKTQEKCLICNPSLLKSRRTETPCAAHSAETEELAGLIVKVLAQPRKPVKTVRCLSCRSSVAPAKFSIFWGVCKNCVTEARGKSKLAQSNFIERTLNNVRKNLRGAIQNV
jgi:hypothetical protein